MVPADSHRVSRVRHYLGEQRRGPRLAGCLFVYGAITLYGLTFQTSSTKARSRPEAPQRPPAASHYPRYATPAGLTRIGFGLFPVRSPLLGESRLLSFPRATKMFQFARLPPPALWVQAGVTPRYRRWVAPFGNPRVSACLQLTEAVSLLATPFIGSQRQGIHRAPLVAWSQKENASRRYSSTTLYLYHYAVVKVRAKPS